MVQKETNQEEDLTPRQLSDSLRGLFFALHSYKRQEEANIETCSPNEVMVKSENMLTEASRQITEVARLAETLVHPLADKVVGVLRGMSEIDPMAHVQRPTNNISNGLDPNSAPLDDDIKPSAFENDPIIVSGQIEDFLNKCQSHSILDNLKSLVASLDIAELRKQDYFLTNHMNLEDISRNSLKILQRRFEDAANKYPGMKHVVMSWPWYCPVPAPPDRMECSKANRCLSRTRVSYVISGENFNRIVEHWMIKPSSHGWNCTAAAQEVAVLSREAGGLLNISDPAGHEMDKWLFLLHEHRKLKATYDWPELHMSTDQKKTVWGTVFDGIEIDAGLYQYVILDDVFLYSALACEILIQEPDNKTSAKEKTAASSEVKPKERQPQKVGENETDDGTREPARQSAKVPLNIRVANAVIKHQNTNSTEIAKMVDSTASSVRTTSAWEMRKQLRKRYNPAKGWKDGEGNYDAIEALEITAEHYDIYEMVQKYKTGKDVEYPSFDFIAEKLDITAAKAKELFKEAQSMLDFSTDQMD